MQKHRYFTAHHEHFDINGFNESGKIFCIVLKTDGAISQIAHKSNINSISKHFGKANSGYYVSQ